MNPHQLDFPGLLQTHGPDYRACGWGSVLSQEKRFAQLVTAIETRTEVSLIDVGCGTGELVPYLLRMRPDLTVTRYVGIDVFPTMVEATRSLVTQYLPEQSVETYLAHEIPPLTYRADPLSDPLDLDGQPFVIKTDYVFVGGVMTHLHSHRLGYELMRRAWDCCRVACVINALDHTWPPGTRETVPLRYDPSVVLTWARLLTSNIRYDHTYLPHDFTVTLLREIDV